MNETGTAARAWMNPTETEQRAETQILRPSFRLISGLENTLTDQGKVLSREILNDKRISDVSWTMLVVGYFQCFTVFILFPCKQA